MNKHSMTHTSVQILTGVTMLVGLSEGAQAGIMLPEETQNFSVSASDTGTGNDSSGSGSFSGTDEHSFSLFDTMGGTRELTDVEFTWGPGAGERSDHVSASASVSHRGVEGSEPSDLHVDANATFTIDLDLSGTSTFFTQFVMAPEDSCAADLGQTCNATASSNPVLDGIYSPGPLAIFEADGGGQFGIDLSIIDGEASYAVFGSLPEAAGWISINSSWDGQFTVAYEYKEIPTQIPEPTSLLLFSAGLAGLGANRKLRKSSIS